MTPQVRAFRDWLQAEHDLSTSDRNRLMATAGVNTIFLEPEIFQALERFVRGGEYDRDHTIGN